MSDEAHIHLSRCAIVNKIADIVVINNHIRCLKNLCTVLKLQIVVECQLLELLDYFCEECSCAATITSTGYRAVLEK
jgi:hypothetical protein